VVLPTEPKNCQSVSYADYIPYHTSLQSVCTAVQYCCKGRSNKYMKWHFGGVAAEKPLNRLTQNLAWVITPLSNPNGITVGSRSDPPRMGDMLLVCAFYSVRLWVRKYDSFPSWGQEKKVGQEDAWQHQGLNRMHQRKNSSHWRSTSLRYSVTRMVIQ